MQLETPYLRRELNRLWPRRGRDLCVQWNHLKLIVFYYHFVPAIYSAVHRIDTEEDAPSLAHSYSHPALCLFVCSVTVWARLPIRLWTQRARLPVQVITFECICSRTVKNNQWSAEVCRLAGSCRGLKHSGCDRDSSSPLEAVISVLVKATAQRGGLEGVKDF